MISLERLLFIGIGGTGGKVGLQLEDNLRLALCGPSGSDLLGELGDELQPQQLPDFVRSVYIDLDVNVVGDLSRSQVAKSHSAVSSSRRILQNLMPPAVSYPNVSATLRAGAASTVSTWLPPQLSEPRISPLSAGAGQFPTIGRAALYEMLRCKGAQATLIEPIQTAIGELEAADRQLRALTGNAGYSSRKCNVYVAFSAAGGTGAGLFLDVLHLIEHCFSDGTRLIPVIHPIVALPSSFEEQKGGGQAARLNAASALLDLSRYVDGQNAGVASTLKLPDGRTGTVDLQAAGNGLTSTAYLFSRPRTHKPDDHIRVMANFIAAKITPTASKQVQSELNHDQTSVNNSASRSDPSPQAVGLHPFTTAYSGALTVPSAELSDLLADLILADGVKALISGTAIEAQGISDDRVLDILRIETGIIDAQNQGSLPKVPTAINESGAAKIKKKLSNERSKCRASVENYREELIRDMPALARFKWRRAIRAAVESGSDPIQLARVVGVERGTQNQDSLRAEFYELGRSTITAKSEPPRLDGIVDPRLHRILRWKLLRLRSDDASVTSYLTSLARWQKERARELWHDAWKGELAASESTFDEMAEAVRLVIRALHGLVRKVDSPDDSFSRLFERRQGVVNYVPMLPTARSLDTFRETALRRIYQTIGSSPEHTSAPVQLLHELGCWKLIGAAAASGRGGPVTEAIEESRKLLSNRVSQILRTTDVHDEALLPSLAEMLQWAAEHGTAPNSDLSQKIGQVLASVLASATDIGLEPSQIVVSYPVTGTGDIEAVENFLRRLLDESAPAAATLSIQASNSPDLHITTIRSEVALLSVPEVRRCIATWDRALRSPALDHRLWWRQRSGWNTSTYLTSSSDHVVILFSLLNGLWSGFVQVVEEESSGSHVVSVRPPNHRLRQYQELLADVEIQLKLVSPTGLELSPWSGLIPAFERFVVNAHDSELEVLAQWMSHIPDGVTRSDPSSLQTASLGYWAFRDAIVNDQQMIVTIEAQGGLSSGEAADLQFVSELLDGPMNDALDLRFPGDSRYLNHRELGTR